MARKTQFVQCQHEGRDKGKMFRLVEMPSSQAEKWAIKLFIAMAKSGVEVPDNIKNLGMAGMLILGLKSLSGVTFEDAEPLLDEMMGCVSFMPDPSKENIIRSLIEDDIEEIKTRLWLREELIRLHAGFIFADSPSESTSGSSAGQPEK